MEEVKDKIFCFGNPNGNSALETAALMNGGFNGGSAMWNNPMMYLVWLAVLGNGGFGGFGGRGFGPLNNAEIQSRLTGLQATMDTNHNNEIALDAIRGNAAAIKELQMITNTDYNTISTAICGVRNAITEVSGKFDYNSERVINAANLGNMNILSKLSECCCQNKELVLTQGFQNQLAQKDTLRAMGDQTYTINERLTGIANGLQKGFSDLGYVLAQNKGETINAINAAQQRTSDLLNNHWANEMSQALQDEKFKNSQLQQNIYFRDLMEKKGSCCGC